MNTAPMTEHISTNISSDDLGDKAQQALEKSDAQELYRHYLTAMRKVDNMAAALETVANHYVKGSDTPRYLPSSDAISAMERVALAAIDLAKTYSRFATKDESEKAL